MATAIHIELNVICLIILLAIALQSEQNVNQQMKRILFRNVVYGIISAGCSVHGAESAFHMDRLVLYHQ